MNRATLFGLLLLAAGTATAAEPASSRWYAVATTGAQAYLSPNRTMGGYGGGLGARWVKDERYVLQADASYLVYLGNVASLRLSGGLQWPGTWSPAVLATAGVLLGNQFTFFQPDGPVLGNLPAPFLALSIAPLRFSTDAAQVSVLQLGLAGGTDFAGFGWGVQLTVLEIAIAL